MTLLFVVVIIGMLGLAYMWFEAGFLEVKKVSHSKEPNLKVMQLSDIHIYFLRVSPSKVKKVILKEKPDCILICGDYINSPSQIPVFIDFLNEINCGPKIFLCLGNHDFKTYLNKKNGTIDKIGLQNFIKTIEDSGCTVLQNRSVQYEKNSNIYNIIGISDLRYRQHNIEKAFSSADKDAFKNIAFSHNPDIVLEIPEGKADYLFCGHFHGGQIWMPFNFEFKLLRKETLSKMGIHQGLHKINGINIYLNRGLGNVAFLLRFLSRPEITIHYIP